jgi:hypothetical protein
MSAEPFVRGLLVFGLVTVSVLALKGAAPDHLMWGSSMTSADPR